MIARMASTGWQTILADLSLILFMVTASALANAPDGPLGPAGDPLPASHPRAPGPAPKPAPIAALVHAEPIGVWRAAAGAPPLGQWLHDVARDPRLRLTITVHYPPDAGPALRKAALAQALHLDAAAGAHAADARVVVEPGLPAGASAMLGYDADGTQIAYPGP
ncbi:hypothetical protein [Novosphingobium sp.]|uniref:hypothetical protein n=1 Tax=Novosphingobium sp. TaxID=1874826 RepID=UPI003D0D6A45